MIQEAVQSLMGLVIDVVVVIMSTLHANCLLCHVVCVQR